MNPPNQLNYRAEIDGLRAIAVISVILYHAKMVVLGRDWFKGGYIGVDIFFVISGYLITRLILSELQTKGSFSFLNFYERRARRILPMLLVVIFFSIPYAWQNLMPSDFVEYAESVLASLFFGSNFFFYFTVTEYGAGSSLLKPFLHTWSLAVEEQFYLVFPVIAIIAFKFFRKHFLTIIVGLSLLSLQFAELMVVRNFDLNFYFPFSRFWGLAVGSVLAYRELNYKSAGASFFQRVLPMLGLYLVAYGILFFNGETPHPSFHTIIPVLGVALIIGFSSKDELVGKILGSKPFVWIGLISYSAYLWHFPIFAFSRMSEEPSNYDKFWLVILTLLLSVASYFGVEKPFRSRKTIKSKMLWLSLSLSTALVCLFMVYVKYSDGIWARFTKVQQDAVKGYDKPEYRAFDHPLGELGIILRSNTLSVNCGMRIPTDACRYGNQRVVFLGDSYVGHYERAFFDELLTPNRLGFISFSYEQCPFVSDQIWFSGMAECPLVNEQRRSLIEEFEDPKIFIISANEGQFSVPKRRVEDPLEAGRAGQTNGEAVDPAIAWNSYFENINWLVSKGHKVVLIRTLPQPRIDGAQWLSSNLKYLPRMNFPNIYNDSKPSDIKALDNQRFPKFDASAVLVLDPSDALCDSAKDICMDVIEGHLPLYNGGRHLSYTGASLVAELLQRKLVELGWLNE